MGTEAAPIAVDVFAGAGGLSEGLLASGIHVAVAVEGHPHAALTNAFNHADTSVLCGDIRKVSRRHLISAVKKRTGQSRIDLIAGGPPCQGFSCAGKKDEKDPRNQLVSHFLRLIGECNPRAFIFENVPAFAQFDGGRRIRKILDGFWQLGYRICGIDNDSEYYPEKYPITNSAYHGVPQLRRRLILIGWKPDQVSGDIDWPIERLMPGRRPLRDAQTIPNAVTVEQAIADLAFLPGGLESHKYMLKSSSAYQRSRRLNTDLLLNHLATRHRTTTISMFRRIGRGKTINSVANEFRSGKQRMRRLDPDGIAPAVLALPDDYLHYARHRIPTVRELARLQSFDDDYVFLGKRTTSDLARQIDVPQYTQVGNAVPPLLARAIGLILIRALGGTAKDLRQLPARRERHRLLRGSSGFLGYTLAPEAQNTINLVDISGKLLELPISYDEEPVAGRTKLEDWTQRPIQRDRRHKVRSVA